MSTTKIRPEGWPGSLSRRCQTHPFEAVELIAAVEGFVHARREEHLITRLNDEENAAYTRMVEAMASLKEGAAREIRRERASGGEA